VQEKVGEKKNYCDNINGTDCNRKKVKIDVKHHNFKGDKASKNY